MASKKKNKAAGGRKKASKKAGNGPSKTPLHARVTVNSSEGFTPLYANFAEASHSMYEFMITFGRIPTKVSPAQAATVRETGVLELEPEAQIMLPPNLVPALIRVLETEVAKYEEQHGTIDAKLPE